MKNKRQTYFLKLVAIAEFHWDSVVASWASRDKRTKNVPSPDSEQSGSPDCCYDVLSPTSQ